MRVIVCGSRDWRDVGAIRRRLEKLPAGTVIVHGGCRGADRHAAEAARKLWFTIEEHPADWSRHGKAAGPIRNQGMADAGADLCIAFPLDKSSGTWDMIRKAEKAGIPVEVYGRDFE